MKTVSNHWPKSLKCQRREFILYIHYSHIINTYYQNSITITIIHWTTLVTTLGTSWTVFTRVFVFYPGIFAYSHCSSFTLLLHPLIYLPSFVFQFERSPPAKRFGVILECYLIDVNTFIPYSISIPGGGRFLKVCQYNQLRRNSCYDQLFCNSC